METGMESKIMFRLSESLFKQFKRKAAAAHLPMSAIVRILIERYIRGEIGLEK